LSIGKFVTPYLAANACIPSVFSIFAKLPECDASKLEFAVIYADDGISGTNTKKREDFNSFVHKLSEKEQQKKL